VKLVYLVGFIIKKFVTMHGHMNVNLHSCLEILLVVYYVTMCQRVEYFNRTKDLSVKFILLFLPI